MKERWVHTPTDTEIRRAITSFDIAWTDDGAAYDRWLAAHDAEVAAKALDGAAHAMLADAGSIWREPVDWLRAQAAGIREAK